MPEGPEIRRSRDELVSVLEGRQVADIKFTFPRLRSYQKKLNQHKIISVESRGKAMLIHFDNDLTVYSHNQLYGRWYVAKDKKLPDTKRQLRLAISTKSAAAYLFSASDIEVLKREKLSTHPYLKKLGLELLAPETTQQMVYERLQSVHHARRSLMNLLQDQSVLSGMGNYLVCEALHVTRLHPETRLCDLDKKQLKVLANHCLKLTRQSYETDGITNALSRAKKMKRQGVAFEDYRFYVYRRAGEVCYQCGGEVVKGKFSGKMGYCCLGCQR